MESVAPNLLLDRMFYLFISTRRVGDAAQANISFFEYDISIASLDSSVV